MFISIPLEWQPEVFPEKEKKIRYQTSAAGQPVNNFGKSSSWPFYQFCPWERVKRGDIVRGKNVNSFSYLKISSGGWWKVLVIFAKEIFLKLSKSYLQIRSISLLHLDLFFHSFPAPS